MLVVFRSRKSRAYEQVLLASNAAPEPCVGKANGDGTMVSGGNHRPGQHIALASASHSARDQQYCRQGCGPVRSRRVLARCASDALIAFTDSVAVRVQSVRETSLQPRLPSARQGDNVNGNTFTVWSIGSDASRVVTWCVGHPGSVLAERTGGNWP